MNDKIKLKREINKTKLKLIDYVKINGIYENFGQKEVGKLTDKHINISSYTDEMNDKRNIIKEFDDWTSSYNG